MLKYNIHAPEKHILGNLDYAKVSRCDDYNYRYMEIIMGAKYYGIGQINTCQFGVQLGRSPAHLHWLLLRGVCVCVCVIRKNEPNFVALLFWLKLYISHKLHVSGPGKLNLSYTSQTRLILVECLFVLISFENNMFNMNAAISSLSALRIGAQNGIKRCRNKHIWWFGRGRICLTKSYETMFHLLLNWMI